MEIKKFLEKIYEIYSDFSIVFTNYEKIKGKESSNNELLLARNDLINVMLNFCEKNTNKHSEPENTNKNEDSDMKIYIDLFLNLMFDEVKKFKIIRPKKTGSK
jgi:hypothetical protein